MGRGQSRTISYMVIIKAVHPQKIQQMPLAYDILKDSNFRQLVSARMFCHMGLQALAVIAGWQIYSLTKSEFLLGLIGLTEAIPAILSALFSGYVVDISTPHRVYIMCVTTLCLNLGGLFLLGGSRLSYPRPFYWRFYIGNSPQLYDARLLLAHPASCRS